MICDSTSLIIFGKLNKLGLLKRVFSNLLISEAVYKEVVRNGIINNTPDSFLVKDFLENKFITVKKLEDKWNDKSESLRKTYQLGKGEAQSIALALQEHDELLTDDKTARKVAKLYGLNSGGSLRVLLLAFKKKFITEKEVQFLITEMTSHNFRLSGEIINQFWILFDKLKKEK